MSIWSQKANHVWPQDGGSVCFLWWRTSLFCVPMNWIRFWSRFAAEPDHQILMDEWKTSENRVNECEDVVMKDCCELLVSAWPHDSEIARVTEAHWRLRWLDWGRAVGRAWIWAERERAEAMRSNYPFDRIWFCSDASGTSGVTRIGEIVIKNRTNQVKVNHLLMAISANYASTGRTA